MFLYTEHRSYLDYRVTFSRVNCRTVLARGLPSASDSDALRTSQVKENRHHHRGISKLVHQLVGTMSRPERAAGNIDRTTFGPCGFGIVDQIMNDKLGSHDR